MHHVDPEVGCLHELVRIRVTDATGQGLGWGLGEGRRGGGWFTLFSVFSIRVRSLVLGMMGQHVEVRLSLERMTPGAEPPKIARDL